MNINESAIKLPYKLKIKPNNFLINFLIYFVFLPLPLLTQYFTIWQYDTTIQKSNLFSNILDKQYNIYRLNNSFSLRRKIFNGEVFLANEYSGLIIQSNENAVRDFENFKFHINFPISTFFNVFATGNYNLNSDSKSIGLNQAEKMNSEFGIYFTLTEKINPFISFGIERNKQISVINYGPRFTFGLNNINIKLPELNIEGKFLSENCYLNFAKRNKNLISQLKIYGLFDEVNSFDLSLNYFNNQRDYVAYPIITNEFFERRIESRLSPVIAFDYNIWDSLKISFNANINSYQIKRTYNKPIIDNPNTSIERTLLEQSFDVTFKFKFINQYFSPLIGINFFFRNEENSLNKLFPIEEQRFNQIALIESQKNNYQNKINFFYYIQSNFNQNNALALNGSLSIFRYDTPSNLNDDDRDEFNFLSNISYLLRFSKILSLKTELDLQLNHLVFLKASKSSLNNWNRVIRFSLSPELKTQIVHFSPMFEVISNYIVYDFEINTNTIQSYAFRQFTYRDTLLINFTKNSFLSGNLVYKYSERGLLYWKNFAMTKETEIYELFLRELLYCRFGKRTIFGIGTRVYNIKQSSLSKLSLQNLYTFYSFSPETEIRIFLSNNNVVFLQGWYELKFGDYKLIGETPNLLLSVSLSF